jgi:hypothetical protein
MAETYNKKRVENVLDAVLNWSRSQRYRGYNKHDGLNSPLLHLMLGWAKWPRLIAIQGVMRSPLNLRPLLGVKKTYNPKGLSLFTRAYLDRYRATGDKEDLAEAQRLLALLDSLRSSGNWHGDCWGYHYPWQDLGFYAPTNTPNAVVTSFVCLAYLDAYRLTSEQCYLDRVKSAIQFFLNDLTVLKDETDELCLAYMPMSMCMRVMDVSILIGSVIAQYAALSGDNREADTARRLVNYVVQRQTDYGAWYYTDPPEDSPIDHDNYHTGFILDALYDYMQAAEDTAWQEVYEKGLRFYAEKLFNKDGSPRWMSDKDYPHDIHGAAQGIITFSRHSKEYPGMVEKINAWVLQNMYHSQGRFYYQQTPRYIKRFTLLRWCNGWMVRALATWLRSP